MTTFHLVRHATYGLLGRSVLAGRAAGHGLDDTGRHEAERIAGDVALRPVRRILSGPLERARQTAAPLARRLGLAVEPSALIDELDYGDWTGRDWRTLADDPAWRSWNTARGVAAIPGGETIGDVQVRSLGLLRRLASELGDDGEAALFTHADVIRAVLAASIGLAPDFMGRIAIDPASRSVLRFGPDGPPTLLGVNLPPP